jgi:hypothetical protein
MKAADRRQAARTKLVEIAYIGMGPENGGLVLDVSDGGLSFHSVAPVHPADKVHFLLSLRGHSRIEGAGEVVWTNQMGTVCGLKFTSLSAGALEHLNNWTNQSRMAQSAPASPRAKAMAPALKPASAAPSAISAAPDAGRSLAKTAPVFAIPPAAVARTEANVSESVAGMRWQSPFFFGAAFGVLAAALAVVAFLYGVHVGKSEFKPAARFAAAASSQPIPANDGGASVPSPPAADSAQSTRDEAPPGSNVMPPVPGNVSVDPSKAESLSATVAPPSSTEKDAHFIPKPRADQDPNAGKAEFEAALAQLNGDNGKRDANAAVRLLWAAVAKGNSTAELTLADLYTYGDGFEKNCNQARALLNAASASGNAQAKVKLDELSANGCR